MHVSEQRKKAALDLRAKIYAYLCDNPGINQTQVCDKFGITSGTVSRHVRAIRNGWRPKGGKS